MNNYKNITIGQLLERLFILVALFILIITFFGSFYFNYRSIQILQEVNIQKTHEILTSLLIPALKIGDSTEVRRLLKMSSNNNEIFAVLDENSTFLLPDYSQLYLIKAGIKDISILKNCKESYNYHYRINNKSYLIHCSPLFNTDIFAKQKIGVLISFSPYSWITLTMSPMILYFLITILLGLLITICVLRYILKKRIVKPLLELNHYIVNQADKPLTVGNSKLILDQAYFEVIAIKNAFEKVLFNLKDEYHQRSEFEKKTALLDLAAHVAHDVRSSLTVIEIMVKTITNNVPLNQITILNEAIQNVRYTLNNLLDHYRNPSLQKITSLDNENIERSFMLSNIIDLVILQKTQEWKINPCRLITNLDDIAKLKWIYVSPNEIKRLLSNLLNNSYESLICRRNIILRLVTYENQLELTISDTGYGIPQNKINDVLNGLV